MQQFAVIDQEHAETVLQYKWFINDKGVPSANRKGKYITMGSLLMNGKLSRGDKVEYVNGNKLDHRMINLQILTKDHDKKGKKTENRGVRKVYTRAGTRWVVYIPIDGIYTASGSFEDAAEATATHDKMIREQLGERAPVLDIKQWARLVRVPLGTRQESDQAYQDTKTVKVAIKKEKKGGDVVVATRTRIVDPRTWTTATGWNPGDEPEGTILFDRGGVITEAEMSRMATLDRDYHTPEYDVIMSRWWEATRPESLLAPKTITT